MTNKPHQVSAAIATWKTTSEKLDAAILLSNTFKDHNQTTSISAIISQYYTDEKLKKKVKS